MVKRVDILIIGSFAISILALVPTFSFLGNTMVIMALTQEELIQIENEPILTLNNCMNRQDFNRGDLCDSFYQHLDGKCKRLDYLPSYCGTVIRYNLSAFIYAAGLSIKEGCLQKPPMPNETEFVKICKDYVDFDSRYYLVPPELKINSVSVRSNESVALSLEEFLKSKAEETADINENPALVTVNMTVKNRSIGGIHVESISFSIIQKGKTILSDSIGSSQDFCSSKYIGCVSYAIDGLTNYQIIRESKAEAGKIDLNDPKFMVNGSFNYKYDNSGKMMSESFSVAYP